jgi:hypothetical protein
LAKRHSLLASAAGSRAENDAKTARPRPSAISKLIHDGGCALTAYSFRMPTRRAFLRDASLIGAASLTLASTRPAAAWDSPQAPRTNPADLARDEAFWARIAAQYRVPAGVTNLEGGYFGMMAAPVLEAFHRNTDRANGGSSYFARREFGGILQSVRGKVAAFIGCKTLGSHALS